MSTLNNDPHDAHIHARVRGGGDDGRRLALWQWLVGSLLLGRNVLHDYRKRCDRMLRDEGLRSGHGNDRKSDHVRRHGDHRDHDRMLVQHVLWA